MLLNCCIQATASGSLNPSIRPVCQTRPVRVASGSGQTIYDDCSSVMTNDTSHPPPSDTRDPRSSDCRSRPVVTLVEAATSTADHFVQNVPDHIVMSASATRSLISHSHLTSSDDSGIGELLGYLDR